MAKSFSPAAANVSVPSAFNTQRDDDDDKYVCQLDAVTEEKAKRELNEDPKDRLNAVRALRTWIRQQPHISFYTDTLTLLSFLRTAKFSQLKAREMIEKYATVVTENPRWFRDIDTCDPMLLKVIESGYAVILPKKDKDGRQLLLYRFGNVAGIDCKLTADHEIRIVSIIGFESLLDENVQVNGYVFIMDFTGFTMKHFTRWSMEDMKKWNTSWQFSNQAYMRPSRKLRRAYNAQAGSVFEGLNCAGNIAFSIPLNHNCMPGRFKAIHYYNAGAIFETMMAVSRPFLKKKIQDRRKRTVFGIISETGSAQLMDMARLEHLPRPSFADLQIFVHDTLESLYKQVDMELLPTDYLPDDYTGPSAGSVAELVANFKRKITEPAYRNMVLESTSSRFGIDESKRPAYKAVNESFRKLAVD